MAKKRKSDTGLLDIYEQMRLETFRRELAEGHPHATQLAYQLLEAFWLRNKGNYLLEPIVGMAKYVMEYEAYWNGQWLTLAEVWDDLEYWQKVLKDSKKQAELLTRLAKVNPTDQIQADLESFENRIKECGDHIARIQGQNG